MPQVKYYAKYYSDDETWAEIAVEQLAEIQETNEKLRSLNDLLAQCRKLVGSFNHNGDLKRELKQQQQNLAYDTRIRLKSETNVRFGYIYNMINSICCNERALDIISSNPSLSQNMGVNLPDSDDFLILNELAEILYPLKDFITLIGASKYPTISHLFPLST